jgi:hypothetical protein
MELAVVHVYLFWIITLLQSYSIHTDNLKVIIGRNKIFHRVLLDRSTLLEKFDNLLSDDHSLLGFSIVASVAFHTYL